MAGDLVRTIGFGAAERIDGEPARGLAEALEALAGEPPVVGARWIEIDQRAVDARRTGDVAARFGNLAEADDREDVGRLVVAPVLCEREHARIVRGDLAHHLCELAVQRFDGWI